MATLATDLSLKDLKVFLTTLALFNSQKPTVYLLCDSQTRETIEKSDLYGGGRIIYSTNLDQYSGETRISMVKIKDQNYKTRWDDFMMEKATVVEQAFAAGERHVFFCDSDICFMGPLPIIPPSIKLGLCRHMIRPKDEALYGRYNGGFLYTTDSNMPQLWRLAATRSRFYDQAALEEVEKKYSPNDIHYLSIQNNYGWWRMFKGSESSETLASRWSFIGDPLSSGMAITGEPLLSVHTHWGETKPGIVYSFNKYLYDRLCKLRAHPPAESILKILDMEFPHLSREQST